LEKAPESQIWCKPIPLTEEWLLRFGFEKKYKNYEMGDFMFFKGSCSRISYKLSLIGINIKHVHQLQNLYFALTGEELKLKDDEND
jgi:hypothetical protein